VDIGIINKEDNMNVNVVKHGWELYTPVEWFALYPTLIEKYGRTCYKSEDKTTKESSAKFIKMLIKSGHHSVVEHLGITVKITCDRACSHQLVRHRLAAYSQESQRYCDYGYKGLNVIVPPKFNLAVGTYNSENKNVFEDLEGEQYEIGTNEFVFLNSVYEAYDGYSVARDLGIKPEDARVLLPNATKTEVVTTYNLRQWRHVFEDRALNPRAQWQIREIMCSILQYFGKVLPDFFGDQSAKLTGDFSDFDLTQKINPSKLCCDPHKCNCHK